jgi:hypothetical protein
LYSQILPSNDNAIQFNKSLGFKEITSNYDIIVFKLNSQTFYKKKTGFILKGIIKKMKDYHFILKD